MMVWKEHKIFIIATGFVLLFCILQLIRWNMLRDLPENNVHLSHFMAEDTLEIPPRPGIQGIIITGPVIKDLVFEIDGRKAGLKKLDWQRLQAIDKEADVKIRARVTDNGNLEFSRAEGDIKDEGHPQAGKLIESVVRSWAYTPYKTGTILFWFNVPSMKAKLVIDTGNLQRKANIDPNKQIYDELLYYTSGLQASDVHRGGKVDF